MGKLTEADMAKPVMQWLADRGFTPYGEVPWSWRWIDVVGVKDQLVETIEMKLSLTNNVIYQANLTLTSARRAWCAVATTPRKLAERSAKGMLAKIGVLRVANGSVEVLRAAPDNDRHCGRWSDLLLERCTHMEPWGAAGLPTMAGVGPAQNCFNRVEKYLASNPDAKWPEIFAFVANHYAHPKSMQSAMHFVSVRRKLRKTNQE